MILADKEPENDKITLDITKKAMELPTEKAGSGTKQPRAVYVTPENPKALKPYQGVVDSDYCGRCGYGWYDKHECADFVNSDFEKFRRESELRRKK